MRARASRAAQNRPAALRVEHRRQALARALRFERAVDQVQVARPAASCADRELAGQMCRGASREGSHLLVVHMDPLDPAVTSNGVGEAVEAITDNSIDSLDAGSREY